MKSTLRSRARLSRRSLAVLAITVITGLCACSSSGGGDEPLPDELPSNDGLTEAQRQQLPGDCLLAFDNAGIAYCFSAPTRKFTSVNPDGTANWDYSLPGDNTSNHVEGIAVIDENLCIVADVTAIIGDSRHEVSCFGLSGAFNATVPVLEPLPRLGDPVKPRDPLAINLDDESLLTTASEESFYLAGSEYLLTEGSDPSVRDSWSRIAGFLVRVDPLTGQTLAWHSFPNSEVTEITQAEDGRVSVTFQPVDSATTNSLTLDGVTLAAQSGSGTGDILNTDDLPQLMPDIIAVLTGKPMGEVEAQLLGIVDGLPVELYFGEDNFCTSFNDGLGCEYNYGPIQSTVSCPVSGSVMVATSGASSWSSPNKSDSRTADWLFDQCVIAPADAVSDGAASKDERVHSINGRWQYTQFSASSTPYESESRKSVLDQLTLTRIDLSTVSADGELTRLDGRLSRSGNQYEYLDGKINGFASATMEISDTNFGYHIDRTPSGYESDSVSIEFDGPELIGATLATQATRGEPIRVDVSESDIRVSYVEELNLFFFGGFLDISASDGSNVTLSALEPPDGLGTELVEYSLNSGGATTVQRLPAASWYLPYHATGADPLEYLYRDTDADGITDLDEGELDSDADGTPDYLDTDSDNDGIPDATEGDGNSDEYSNNPDTLPDYLDDDADGDTISDIIEGAVDSDGDRLPDFLDQDSDNDSLPDELEGADDFDGDGTPNYLDEDSDGDGLRDQPDGVDDFDGDGSPNFLDEDSDNDGIPDSVEGFEDRDADGRPDYVDPD